MIRQPTPSRDLLAWHRRALAGERVPVFEDEPHCGWFRFRMVRLGPWLPARIWMHQVVDPVTRELAEPEEFRAEALGEPRDPYRLWVSVARHPITPAAYRALVDEHRRNPRMAATHVRFEMGREAVRP